MQPYFLPYIGYYQLISAVDTLVLYDNIKYTKKGWINRNRMLSNSRDAIFSIPIKKGSDSLNIVERELSESFHKERLLGRFRETYRKAPYYDETWQLLKEIIFHDEINLFRYIYRSLVLSLRQLNIKTTIVVSSKVPIDHSLKAEAKVLAICKRLGATSYINPIGGRELYSKEFFNAAGIELSFLESQYIPYSQFGDQFVPWLSIVDVLMFNNIKQARSLIMHSYSLI